MPFRLILAIEHPTQAEQVFILTTIKLGQIRLRKLQPVPALNDRPQGYLNISTGLTKTKCPCVSISIYIKLLSMIKEVRSNLNKPAFTIVELLVVVVVIVILAAVSIVAYNGVLDRARNVAIQSDLSGASKQLAMYHYL